MVGDGTLLIKLTKGIRLVTFHRINNRRVSILIFGTIKSSGEYRQVCNLKPVSLTVRIICIDFLI